MKFSDDFSDGYDTALIPAETMSEMVWGPIPTEELPDLTNDVEITTDDAVPVYVDPTEETTKRMVRNILGQYEERHDDEITIVETVKVINKEAA